MKRHAFDPVDRQFSLDFELEVPARCGRWYFAADDGSTSEEPCRVCVRVVGVDPTEAAERLRRRMKEA